MFFQTARDFLNRESFRIIASSIRKGNGVFLLGLGISIVSAATSVVLPYLSKLEIDQMVAKRGFQAF